MSWQRPNIGSRVTREGHARFWERPAVRLLRATRQSRRFRDVRVKSAYAPRAATRQTWRHSHPYTSGDAIRGAGVTEHYSALILTGRITLRHFPVSSAISLPKSAGESVSTSPPRSASRALILGSASGH